jgi:hypothetical protein
MLALGLILYVVFIKILALLIPGFLLISCSSTIYNSEEIPPEIKTSEITYKNVGSIALDALIAKDPDGCRNFVHVAPTFGMNESLSPNSSKTIKYPSGRINTTSINYIREERLVMFGATMTKTETAFGTISFKVNHGEHYYVLMSFDKDSRVLRYNIFSIRKGVKLNVPIMKRKRESVEHVCTPLTQEQVHSLL